MPKEIVRNRPELDDGSLPWLSVGWGKDAEYVQVGVVGPDTDFQIMRRAGDGWEPIDTPSDDVGLYVQLDRAGINRAIRALRKARDQAYGRDE